MRALFLSALLLLVSLPVGAHDIDRSVYEFLDAWHAKAHEGEVEPPPPPVEEIPCPDCCPNCVVPCVCEGSPPPPPPPPPSRDGDCYDPDFPLVKEGRCLECDGRIWSARTLSSGDRFARCNNGVLEVTPSNGTGTILGEPSPQSGWQAGTIEFEVMFSEDLVATATGGGTHFLNLIGWLSDRSDRSRVGARWRWEVAQLFKNPKIIFWQIGDNGVERQDTELLNIPPLKANKWYSVRIEWRDGLSSKVKTVLAIDGQKWSHSFDNDPSFSAPRFFEVPGHVDGKGFLSSRNLRISGLR